MSADAARARRDLRVFAGARNLDPCAVRVEANGLFVPVHPRATFPQQSTVHTAPRLHLKMDEELQLCK
jgi:hypothetical protein